MFNLFKKKEIVYCQLCDRELTQEGGFVTSKGDIYCAFEKRKCFLSVLINEKFKMEYRTAKEIQEDIKEKKLIHFKKLEDVVKG